MFLPAQMRATSSSWRARTSGQCVCVRAKAFQSCPALCDPMDCSTPVASVQGFSRQGYWSGLPCPPPGDLPLPGMEPISLTSPILAGRFFTTSTTRQKSHQMATSSQLRGSQPGWELPFHGTGCPYRSLRPLENRPFSTRILC